MVRRRRARGMTLIEVMVALLVATVGLLGALAMVGTVIGGTSNSRNVTEATVLAQAKIEQVQSRSDITVTGTLVPANGPESPAEMLDASGADMSAVTHPNRMVYTRTTTWGGPTSDGQRRTVMVQVTWSDALGKTHYVTAQTERIPSS